MPRATIRRPCVLIVDEINRGNIPKIFGELLFLLEYRNEAVELQYGKDTFSLPGNLFLLGTMNTADRSIALVDAALRRRFFFIPFIPTEMPIASVLRSWLKENGPRRAPRAPPRRSQSSNRQGRGRHRSFLSDVR
jgi:5-methylcytosine-specific restriction enzyme B